MRAEVILRRAVLAALVAVPAACGGPDPVDPLLCLNDRGNQLEPFDDLGYIAHAGGSPGGLLQIERYTNSREAFEVSYQNGFRAFEFDLITIGDGTPIVAHDGHEDRYGTGDFRRATRSDVEGLRWRDKYDLLFVDDLVDLMREYPDVWIVLDTKWDDMVIARAIVDAAEGDSAVLDRVVPHLISDEHVRDLAALYPFPERMIAVYQWPSSDQDLVRRSVEHGVEHVMMWFDRRWSEATQALLEDAGMQVWLHTPHDPAQIEMYRARDIGVYSDGYIGGCSDVAYASEL